LGARRLGESIGEPATDAADEPSTLALFFFRLDFDDPFLEPGDVFGVLAALRFLSDVLLVLSVCIVLVIFPSGEEV
jgi:hypothetical protein